MPHTRSEQQETYENPFGLTNKQRDTIQMAANGYTQKAIATMLCVSEKTIKWRMTAIRAKMDVDTTLQAAVLWVREVEFGNQQLAA